MGGGCPASLPSIVIVEWGWLCGVNFWGVYVTDKKVIGSISLITAPSEAKVSHLTFQGYLNSLEFKDWHMWHNNGGHPS